MQKRLMKSCAAFLAVLTGLSLLKTGNVSAASVETPLQNAVTGEGGSLTVSLSSGVTNLMTATDPVVNYGDPLDCEIDWHLPDTFILNVNDVLTYELPPVINFDYKSGDLMDGNKDLGDYEISGNRITITYTSYEFCHQRERQGHLGFRGRVTNDPDPAGDPDTITVSFPGVRDFTLTVQRRPVTARLSVDKDYQILDDTNHIYRFRIPITATGNQTDITVRDTMWPGMELYNGSIGSMPVIYSDYGMTTEFTDHTPFAIESGDGRTFSCTINNLSDGQTVYVYYDVQVREDMYDLATGDAWVRSQGYVTSTGYYPNGYLGVVPNRVTVYSNEVPDPVTKDRDIYGAGNQFIKWHSAPVGNELYYGYLRWQLVVNRIDPGVTSGYIVDTIPENNSFDISNVIVYDGDTFTGRNVIDYLDITTSTVSGQTQITFRFKDPMLADLKTAGKGMYIEYVTHVDRQSVPTQRYENTATLYLDNTSYGPITADTNYTKPDDVFKTGEYSPATAPYAEYIVIVNPAALDLDPQSDRLILTDTPGSALDIDLGSILVNGVAPDPADVDFDLNTHQVSITLDDATYYRITYRARVNLLPGSRLDSTNAENTCALTGVITNQDDGRFIINSRVYNDAATSSSTISYVTYNVVKYDADSNSTLLSGAVFEIAEATLNGDSVTGTTVLSSQTTDTYGRASFTDLLRGTCYMLTETEAPTGYDRDASPRFIIFSENDAITYPSSVTYNGSSYPVTVYAAARSSFDDYIGNTPVNTSTPAPTEPANTPAASTPAVTTPAVTTPAVTTPADSENTPTPSVATPTGSSSASTPVPTGAVSTPVPSVVATITPAPSTPTPADNSSSLVLSQVREPSPTPADTSTPTPTPTPPSAVTSSSPVVSTGEVGDPYTLYGSLLIFAASVGAVISRARRRREYSGS